MHSNFKTQSDQGVTLRELLIVKESDVLFIEEAENIIRAGSQNDLDQLIKKIKLLSNMQLFAISSNSTSINNLMHTNLELQLTWADKLKKLSGPFEEIIAIDKKVKVDAFSLVKGVLLMNKFDKWEGEEEKYIKNYPPAMVELLNKACDTNGYDPLITRLIYCKYKLDLSLDKEKKNNS